LISTYKNNLKIKKIKSQEIIKHSFFLKTNSSNLGKIFLTIQFMCHHQPTFSDWTGT
jgi:hypothetical protein